MVNADQTCDILVLGRDDLTYKVKGSKQVLIHEKNKKRIFTYVPLVTRIEEVLITQSV